MILDELCGKARSRRQNIYPDVVPPAKEENASDHYLNILISTYPCKHNLILEKAVGPLLSRLSEDHVIIVGLVYDDRWTVIRLTD